MYFCSYDVIADRKGDKRRAKLFDLLKDFGEHVQYSVFFCELSVSERLELISTAREIINQEEDQLIVLEVGPDNQDWAMQLECLGKPWKPRDKSFIF